MLVYKLSLNLHLASNEISCWHAFESKNVANDCCVKPMH